ncbi:MAG: pilus assembly protein PilM [Gallionella sp.]|nr:pilus assembly protein PilM [Gallionella sp.]
MKIVFDKLLKPARDRLTNMLPGFGRDLSIGMDMGPDRLNLVQMELVAGRPAIRAIASLPYPCPREELELHPQKLKSLLKQAYAMQPFKGRRVVSCLPASQIKIITLTYKEGQPDAVAIVAELRERLQGELDNLVVDFMILREQEANPGHRDALVAMAPRNKVLAYLDLLTGAGLEVEALDVGPAALARLVSQEGALHTPEFPLQPNALLINFGADSSHLTVIWGRRLMLDRAVEFCENKVFSRLKQLLDMPQDLAVRLLYEKKSALNGPDGASRMLGEVLRPEIAMLLQEVNKTLVYMASRTHGKSVDVIYLAGRLALYPDVLNAFRDQMKIPVRMLNPVELFASERSRLNDKGLGEITGIALSAGLALRGVPENE